MGEDGGEGVKVEERGVSNSLHGSGKGSLWEKTRETEYRRLETVSLKQARYFGVCFPPANFSFSGSGTDRVEGRGHLWLGFCQAGERKKEVEGVEIRNRWGTSCGCFGLRLEASSPCTDQVTYRCVQQLKHLVAWRNRKELWTASLKAKYTVASIGQLGHLIRKEGRG